MIGFVAYKVGALRRRLIRELIDSVIAKRAFCAIG